MLNYAAALIGLAIASFTDIRERIVPDWLNYAMLAIGLLYHAYLSFSSASIEPVVFSVTGMLIAFAFSYLLWRIGAWAGGDVKLFAALGALTPTPAVMGFPLFPFVIFVNSVLLSFPFVMLHVFAKTLLKKQLRKVFRQMLLSGLEQGLILGGFSTGFYFLLGFFALPQWLSLPLIALAFFLPRCPRLGLAVLLALTAFQIPGIALPFFSVALFVGLFWQAVSFGKDYALRQKIPVSKLEEGMISAETLYLSGNKIKPFIPSLRDKLTFHEPSRTVVSMYRAAGIEKKEIASLRKHGVKSLWIKESIPMVPVFFLGAVSAVFLGSLFELLLELL